MRFTLILSATVVAIFSLLPTKAYAGSFMMKVANAYLFLQDKPLGDHEQFQKNISTRSNVLEEVIPAKLKSKYRVSENAVLGRPVYTLSPLSQNSSDHIIYTHGGGFVNGISSHHWALIDALIEHSGATVTVPIYGKAPKHTYPEALALLTEVYITILDTQPNTITLAGDSAGATLAISQALHFRDLDLAQPHQILLFSPWLDLTLSNPHAEKIEAEDPMLGIAALRICGSWWAGAEDPKNPLLSPLYADVNMLPPIHLFQGTKDIFLVDSRSFVELLNQHGREINYHEYDGGFHVFMAAPWLPESKDVFTKIAELF
jgi:monoterpene epsilon-lactone hydrolase